MKRRTFVGLTSLVLLDVMAGSVPACGNTPTAKLRVVEGRGIVKLYGNPKDVREFCETFQTYLWPDWRTHRSDNARRFFIENTFADGRGAVATHGEQLRAAFESTKRVFAGRLA
jgi:hypothetical protein